MPALIDMLESETDVDVDTMDPKVAKSLPFKPHDMTSNQIIVHDMMMAPENRDMFLQAVREYADLGWEKIYDRVCALLCAKNIENIQGRVLLQVSPAHAYDTDKVVAHARSYAEELIKAGISQERFCIKIPCTGPALIAGPVLAKEGIRTLGTSLFGLAQAIAASQAGCLYISPYYNEIRAHLDVTAWPDVDDPATQHPMSPRMIHILETYRKLAEQTGKEQPIMKAASFLSAKEVMACAEMGCQSITVPGGVLEVLCKTPADSSVSSTPKPMYPKLSPRDTPARLKSLSSIDPLASADWDGKLASTETDYLANGGEELEKANEKDPVVKLRIKEALDLFKDAEAKSRAEIEKALKDLGKSV